MCYTVSCIIIFLMFVISIINASEAANHCKIHHFNYTKNSTIMQLTKEEITQEYAVKSEFKSLHCCAKGYRSIEWFKNGKPYPWPHDVSSLILYPEAENQTIYTRSASLADVGNYTCVLRNDTHKSEHHVALNVQTNVPDTPLPTFRPQNQYVPIGESARLYCEAFVGQVNLPDARNFVTWYQVFENENEQAVGGVQETITRAYDEIVGAYLFIPNVQLHNYGRYLCRIDIGNSAHRLEMSAWIFGQPTVAQNDSMLPALLLGSIAAITVVGLCILGKFFINRHKRSNQCQPNDAESLSALRDKI